MPMMFHLGADLGQSAVAAPHLFVLTFVQLPLGEEIDVKGLATKDPTSPIFWRLISTGIGENIL